MANREEVEELKLHLTELVREWMTYPEPGHVLRRTQLLRWGEQPINSLMPTKPKWTEYIEPANEGDADADAVLCMMAAHLIAAEKTIPEPLASYIALKLCEVFFERQRRRGADGDANVLRNMFIVNCVRIVMAGGVQPTRNEASRDKDGAEDSGCSLVAEALQKFGIDINERGVEEVWRKRETWMVVP